MTIDAPKLCHLPQLKQLWQEAFGDSDAFTELFFAKGFSLDRCLAALEQDTVLGSLYWFDCHPGLAYIYGVGVFAASRGKGVGLALMQAAHDHLQAKGYSGAILCPADGGLFAYYRKLGYTPCAGVHTVKCEAGSALSLRPLSCGDFSRRRAELLPPGAAVQGEAAVEFLGAYAKLLEGEGFLVSAVVDGDTVYGELLGDPSAAPGITAALGCKKGSFRTPGEENFAMFLPLKAGTTAPTYLGLALD